ncbi:MAG: uroporphyrinogen-III synthase, partial [Eubacterium sp.]|nr:uroporphyrinogen-III synthase [Eubacterium sp.]
YSDFVPTAYSSEDMARALLPHLTGEDKVLLLRAEEASPVLPEAFEKAHIPYRNIPLYHTVRDLRKAEELNRLIQTADYITFASSSAVKGYKAMVEDLSAFRGRYISIGPVTTKTAERIGLSIERTAAEYTARGIVQAILEDAAEGNT